MASIASAVRRGYSGPRLDAIAAIKSSGPEGIKAGDIIVLICRGPMGSGMEEIYQITSALKHLSFGKQVALITDARFSGVSTGACIGHVTPEALAGGPVGKVREGDLIEIVIDRNKLEGSVDLVGENGQYRGSGGGDADVGRARAARGSAARSHIAGGFATLGRAAECQRRDMGRLCLRCGGDSEQPEEFVPQSSPTLDLTPGRNRLGLIFPSDRRWR